MTNIWLILIVATTVASPGAVTESFIEPISVLALHENARYYHQTEIAVTGYVVDSHVEWYGDAGEDYMTWNLVISDAEYPDESDHVLLCYESGFNMQRIRECSEIADVYKELGHPVTVIGEYDSANDILNVTMFIYFEEGEPYQLDTDVADRERIRIYQDYGGDFHYDVHYVVWHRHSYIWPRPIWWVWWEPVYIHRPPVNYVVYHTPWRTYRRRIYHPIRVPPVPRRVPGVAQRGNRVRLNPRISRDRIRTAPTRVGRRVSPNRPGRTLPRGGTGRIRTRPTSAGRADRRPSSSPTARVPARRLSRVARQAPRVTSRQNVSRRQPTRTRSTAPTIGRSRPSISSSRPSIGRSRPSISSSRPSIRNSAPRVRTSSRPSPSSGGRTRAAPQRSSSRSTGRSRGGGGGRRTR